MKIKYLLSIGLMLVSVALHGAWLDDVPVTVVQPNGDTLHIFATGDEFYHYMHDADGYTIVQDPVTGYYVYADKVEDELVPTQLVVGHSTPTRAIRQPRLTISNEEYRRRRLEMEGPDAYRVDPNRSRDANHGHINHIVIFISFADDPVIEKGFDEVDYMFNSTEDDARSVFNYFKTVSYDQMQVTSSFYPAPVENQIYSYVSPGMKVYYQPYSVTNLIGYRNDVERRERERQLLEDAIDFVNNSSSPVPNSLNLDYDNDGKIDIITFAINSEEDPHGNGHLLWPHKTNFDDNTTARINGKKPYYYTIELIKAESYFTMNTFCHEMNHVFGAPDFYHGSGDSGDPDPLNTWEVMSFQHDVGCNGCLAPKINNPSAYVKWKYLNWIDNIPCIMQSGSYILGSLGTHSSQNVYKITTEDPNQYYLIEYRNNENPFDDLVPGTGLLVYRVNDEFSGNKYAYYENGIYDELFVFRPQTNIHETGEIENAYLSTGDIFDYGPYLSDGTLDELNITNIVINGEYASFLYLAPDLFPRPNNFSAIVTGMDINMSWEGNEEAISYTVFRDKKELGTITETTYIYKNALRGTHKYYVKANYAEGQSKTSEVIVITIEYESTLVTGLTYEQSDNLVTLVWNPIPDNTYVFQNFENPITHSGDMNNSSSSACEWLECFSPEELSANPGKVLKGLNIWIAQDAIGKKHNVWLYEGKIYSMSVNEIGSLSFTPNSIGLEQIEMDQLIPIDYHKDLIVDIRIEDNDGEYASYQISETTSTNSFFYTNNHLKKIDSNKHWLISLNAKEPVYTYKIYRNGQCIGTTEESSFQDAVVEDGVYNYYVTATGTMGESAPSESITVIVGEPPVGSTGTPFSVDYNKYAYFSQGNLQYQASTNTWRFAEHQWDYVGGGEFGNVYETDDQGQQFKCDNGWISETYNGWIDLFGWGTSGIPHGANCYQPWSTSYYNDDYYAYGQAGRSLYEKNEEDEGALADWGYNAISNGGNELNSGWRTPTAAEWDYLMNTRHTASGIRYAFAVVNDVNGMILLPDDWDASVYDLNDPNPIEFNMSMEDDYESSWAWLEAVHNANTIDADTWAEVFEPTGAVFMPCTGSRKGNDYPDFIDVGYWTSSNADSGHSPFFLWYLNGMLFPSDMSDIEEDQFVSSDGLFVRLIKDITETFVVIASMRQSEGGTVSGEDSYAFGEVCTLEAEANEGYEFVHWTENGAVVSTDPTYSFGVYTNHQLEAHFRNLEEEDPDLLGGLFTVGEDRVARFAKGNLNLDFLFHADGSPDVYWHFAEHQYDCKDFDANAFKSDPVSYMEDYGMDLIYRRFFYDANNNDVVLDLGCWRTLTPEEWIYLLSNRVTASGMHYTFGSINNIPGFILFPDDWNAAYYPIPYNTIDEIPDEDMVFNEISAEDWDAYFEPNHAVFLPFSFKALMSREYNDGFNTINACLNYSFFDCVKGYYDDDFNYQADKIRIEAAVPMASSFYLSSNEGYSLNILRYGYERPVQVGTKNYDIIGAKPNPLWAGEVNGGGIFENQMRDGDTCTLTATAKSGHTFLGWYENDILLTTDTILAFIVEDSRFIEARYSADAEYQVYAEALPWDGGYADGGGQFEEWQECQLEAEPYEHYHFVGWMENDSIVSTSTTYTITVTSERHLQACFAENQSFNLTVNAVPEVGGKVFPSMEFMHSGHGSYYAETYEETETVSIMAAANDGYHFVGWKVGDEWLSMDDFYNFTFPSNDLALEAHFELCEVESEPDSDLLSGRFSISDCTTVGFAKGNVIGCFEQNYETMTSSWEFAPGQYYRQYYREGNMSDNELSTMLKNGMDLVNNTMVHVGMIDFDCWHLLTSEEWNYLLKERDMEIRYAFAKVNNVEGMLVMPDNWNPATYSIISPNENVPYATNSISRYDWNTVLEPAGVLFLPANGAIMSIYQNYHNSIESMYHQGENAIGFYPNMVFMPGMLGLITEEFASEMPMLYSSMRLAQIVEAESSNVELFVEASQADFGMVSGGGEFNCGSSCTVTATPNNGYVFRYWLEEDEVVSTVAEYTFPVTADRNLVAVFAEETEMCEVEIRLLYNESSAREGWRGDAVVLNFGNNQPEVRFTLPVPQIDWYEIYLDHGNTSVNFEELGLPEYLSYPMYVNKDDTITVSYEQSGLSSMYGSEPECIFVLAFADADTIVEGSAAEVLPFTFVGNCDLFASHTKALDNGWNWWSTYIEQEGVDGLSILERSLGYDGNMIKSRSDGYVESYEYEGTIGWFGPLTSIKNEQMYKIDMNTDGKAVMRGLRTETSSHPITINFGWNWIGLPLSQPVAVSQAMSGFSPEVDDVIKGRNGFATYYSSDGVLGWYGTLNILEPGSGYMYQSHANGIKTLVFQEGRGGTMVANITPEDNVYRPNGGRYADNMTVTAVVEVNGEELRSDAYELAAFAGDECRGSVKLMYVEPVDRYVAFLTVFGEQGDDIGFRLTDGTKTLQSPDRIVFVADGVSGSLADPTVLRFGDTGIGETSMMVRIHPNPVDRDARFTISLPLDEDIEEVIVINSIGATVRHETGALKATMEGLSTSGVYTVKATCRSGNVYFGRLIVK